jgi:hypothetical protein
MDNESSRDDKLESIVQDGSSEPHSLPLEYLRNITNNFSDGQLLGIGGFGKVYKVRLIMSFVSSSMYNQTVFINSHPHQ